MGAEVGGFKRFVFLFVALVWHVFCFFLGGTEIFWSF